MIGVRTLARTMLAGIFIYGGQRSLRNAGKLVDTAEPVTAPVESALGDAFTTEQLIRANCGVQVVGGALFAIGVVPRITGLALAATLVPTTLAGHRFWEIEDPGAKATQLLQVLKNAGLAGGLIFAALDTGGRPSIFWSGRRTARSAVDTLSSTVAEATDSITDATQSLLPSG